MPSIGAPSRARASYRLFRAGSLRRLPLDRMTNEFSFSFAPEGWHYLRALLAEYERDRQVRLEETTFWRFFQHERVRSVRYLNDVLYLHDRDTGFSKKEHHDRFAARMPRRDFKRSSPLLVC